MRYLYMIICTCIAGAAWANDEFDYYVPDTKKNGRWYVSGTLATLELSDTQPGGSVLALGEERFDDGGTFSLAVGNYFSTMLAAELEIISQGAEHSQGRLDDYSSLSVLLNGYFYWDLHDSLFLDPYMALGLGFNNWEAGPIENTGFTSQFIAGLNFELNDHWHIFGQWRYRWNTEAKAEDIAGGSSSAANFNTEHLGVGIRYVF